MEIAEMLAQTDLPEELVCDILNSPKENRKFFAQGSACVTLLVDLAFDICAEVRLALLDNPAVTTKIVELLKKDKDNGVAEKAKDVLGG